MQISQKNGVYSLSGRLDEFATFEELKQSPTPLKLNLGKVTSINSMGVRKFLSFARSWAPRKFEFHECTPDFIANINVIPQMLGDPADPRQVKSFYVPYSCQACKKVQSVLFITDEIKFDASGDVALAVQRCSKCGESMQLDVDRKEYFGFLSRPA